MLLLTCTALIMVMLVMLVTLVTLVTLVMLVMLVMLVVLVPTHPHRPNHGDVAQWKNLKRLEVDHQVDPVYQRPEYGRVQFLHFVCHQYHRSLLLLLHCHFYNMTTELLTRKVKHIYKHGDADY